MYINRSLFGLLGPSPAVKGAVSQNVGKMAENHKLTLNASKVALLGRIGVSEGAYCSKLATVGVTHLRLSITATRSCINLFSRLIFPVQVARTDCSN